MATVVSGDYSVAANGDIRYTGTGTNNTVIEFHRWLGDLMDDAQAAGDDLIDITDATASERSTDNIITLNSPYNIDDVVARHLYDGSIIQKNGDEIYDGILSFAPANTPLQIIQNGKPSFPNFWKAGINADASNGISHRFMLKTRTAGADVDGRRIIAQTREVGKTYSEFKINGTARGNNVIALSYANDLNNQTAFATIEGWTTVSNTSEGYVLLDVDNNAVDEPYYSQWNRATYTINQFFERHKWLTRMSSHDVSSDDQATSANLGLGKLTGTLTGQGQSFPNGPTPQILTRCDWVLRKVGNPTGNAYAKLYAVTGAVGSEKPTGTALATSAALDVATLTTGYLEYEVAFEGAQLYEMAASTRYVITIEFTGASDTDYIEVGAYATDLVAWGNASHYGAAAWTADTGTDLWFEVYFSPKIYGIPGEIFRGVTHEVAIASGTGTWGSAAAHTQAEQLSWTGGTGQLLAVDNVTGTATTKIWMQILTGVAPTTGQTLTGTTSSATAVTTGTATERPVSAPPVGASTGSALIGSYGLGMEILDLGASDKVTGLDAVLRTPPNNVTFTVAGLVSGEDRVLVAPLGYTFAYDNRAVSNFAEGETVTFTSPAGTAYVSGLQAIVGTTGRLQIRMLTGTVPTNNSTISGGTSGTTADVNGVVTACEDPRQLKLATTLSGATETAVVCTAAIPTDTPAAGTIRIELDTGIFRRVAYTSYTASTFTIASTSFTGANTATGGAGEAGASMYISYIDKLATASTATFTGVYLADRSLFVRVRDGASTPIKTFETTGTLAGAGGSSTAIRTSDS